MLPKELGKAFGRLFDQRQTADYDFFERASETDSSIGIRDAEIFIAAVKSLVEHSFSINLENEEVSTTAL